MRAHHLIALSVVACAPALGQVRPGIEVLLSDSLHLIRDRRVGLLTNHTGVDRYGRRDVDLLLGSYGQTAIRLTALFSPEHGFRGTEDRAGLPDDVDSATALPIYSLYSGARPPNLAGLDSIEVLLIDLQDIGARYYTYVSSAAMLMHEAARRGQRVVVLDRPNPVGGKLVQGNVRPAVGDPVTDFVGFLPVAMRHGMTLGEMLRMANDLLGVGVDLAVIPAVGWRRPMYFDETGLPWIRPSPNMPSLESAMHYPGTCLFEGTNISVGRGTEIAFQVLGAPWLDPGRVLRRAGSEDALAGVSIVPTTFIPRDPTDGKYDGRVVRGLRLRVTDRARYDPTRVAVTLLAAVHAEHADSLRFRDRGFDRLAAGPALREAILAGRSPAEIWGVWDGDLARFRALRAKYLLY